MAIRYEIKTVSLENGNPGICGLNSFENEAEFKRAMRIMENHGWTQMGAPVADINTFWAEDIDRLILDGYVRICFWKSLEGKSIFEELGLVKAELKEQE